MMASNSPRAPRHEPIAIVGASCLFPSARGLKEYWRLLRRGEDAIRDVPPTHWRASDYLNPDPKAPDQVYCARGGFLDATDFDPVSFGIPPATLEAVDTAQLLGLVVAEQALRDAGILPDQRPDRNASVDASDQSRDRKGATRESAQESRDRNGASAPDQSRDRKGASRDSAQETRDRIGVVLGVTSALEAIIPLGARLGHPHWRRAMQDAGISPAVADEVVRRIGNAYPAWQENSFPGLLGNVVAGRIANRLNLHGTNCVVDAACASSLSALHMAILELTSGRADVMLAGGVDTFNDIFMFMCFAKTQALSSSGHARAFSADADGTVLGEGVGMVVLKRLSDAQRDNDRIYAVIRGVGTSSDGRSQSIYAPRAEGQARCLRDAYETAGVDPATVALIEAHGTGTKVGDAVEFEALRTVFTEAGATTQSCAVGSVKSQIGHTKAAAGIASLIKAVIALRDRVVPGSVKVRLPNPKLNLEESPFFLPTQSRPWFTSADQPRRAGVSSFGFGGSNFHAVLEEYPLEESQRDIAWDGSVEIVALCADSTADLARQLEDWRAFTGRDYTAAEFARRAADSRVAFTRESQYRLALIVERGVDVLQLFATAAEELRRRSGQVHWNLSNIYFAGPQAPGKLAFLFPGQGAQYVNMGRDLVCTFPQAHAAIAEANLVFGADQDRLSDRIFPPSRFSAEAREKDEEALRQTEIAQPALGAVSLAMLRVLTYFGLQPDAAAGHSFGEIPALRAAGRIGDEALRVLSKVRGALMSALHADRGAMLAVQGPVDEVSAVASASGLDVELASRNAPEQSTHAGPREAIEKLMKLCDARGWRSKLLNGATAFHTRMMAVAQERFTEFLDSIHIHPGRVPVYANLTGLQYPDDPAEARRLLARQLTNPVLFMDEVRHMYENGVRTFIEVGPKATLTNFAKSILHGLPVHAAAVDASGGRGCGIADLARVIALVAVLGHTVDLKAWEAAPPEAAEPNMIVKLFGANYRPDQARAHANEASSPAASAVRTDSQIAAASPARAAMPTDPSFQPPRSSPRLGDQLHPHADANPLTSTMKNAYSSSGNGHMPHAFTHGSPSQPEPLRASAHGAASPPDGRMPDSYHADIAPPPPRAADVNTLTQAFLLAQESLRAMQLLQQQTAIAHQQFLQGQESAHRSFQLVMQHQQRLLEQSLGAPMPSAPMFLADPMAAPALAPLPPITLPAPAMPIPSMAAPQAATFAPSAPQAQQPVHASQPTFAHPASTPGTIAGGIGFGAPRQPAASIASEWSQGPAMDIHKGHASAAPANPIGSSANGHPAKPSSAAPQSMPPAASQNGQDSDSFEPVLLDVVAQLTGYPVEMLRLDMDLEADLGIDSIKRLEILASVQERRPDLRQVDSQYLGSLRTLRDIIAHLTGAPDEAAEPLGKLVAT